VRTHAHKLCVQARDAMSAPPFGDKTMTRRMPADIFTLLTASSCWRNPSGTSSDCNNGRAIIH
jgi:hypothetical protein